MLRLLLLPRSCRVQRDTQLRLLPRLGCAGEGAAFCRSSSSRRTQPVAELIIVWMCERWLRVGCAYAGVPVGGGRGCAVARSLSTIAIRLVRGMEIMEMKAAQHGCMLGVKG